MSNNQRQHRGASFADFIPADQLAKIKEYATGPQTLEGKLELFNRLAQEHEVVLPGGRKDRRSRLGSFINKLFNSEFVLPTTGRRQQIGKAVKFAKEYLIEYPEASVYYAAAMGAAEEYREWMAMIGDIEPEQQMAILNTEGESGS